MKQYSGQDCPESIFPVSGVAWEAQSKWVSVPASLEDQPLQRLPTRMAVYFKENELVWLVESSLVRSAFFLSLACCSASGSDHGGDDDDGKNHQLVCLAIRGTIDEFKSTSVRAKIGW